MIFRRRYRKRRNLIWVVLVAIVILFFLSKGAQIKPNEEQKQEQEIEIDIENMKNSDTDGGNNPFKFGTCKDWRGNYIEDECKGDMLIETYMLDERCRTIDVDCVGEFYSKCNEGKCTNCDDKCYFRDHFWGGYYGPTCNGRDVLLEESQCCCVSDTSYCEEVAEDHKKEKSAPIKSIGQVSCKTFAEEQCGGNAITFESSVCCTWSC